MRTFDRIASVTVLSVLIAFPALAQAPGSYTPPRTSWGVPDLQGVWNNTSLTGMERPETASTVVVTREEADQLARRHAYSSTAYFEQQPSRLDAEASQRLLSDGNVSRAYNRFWLDPGASYAQVRGEYRTSWIVSPEDGRIPHLDPGRSSNAPRTQDYGGPEARPQSERCLMSFTGSAGPVMSNGMYNNNYQIVQTPGSVMILTEMIHDVRIVPIGGQHGPGVIPKWGGDSIGRYDGDALVIETINPHPGQRSYISPAGKLTERFTRWSDTQILYEFSVEDPTLYASVWSGEMIFNRSDSAIYEYACHEGNYALPAILMGARAFERAGRPQQAIKQPYNGIDVSEGQ
ncbi:MAG: hypothetical protein R3C46_10510 [Hyphomonadaceae bacterium]